MGGPLRSTLLLLLLVADNAFARNSSVTGSACRTRGVEDGSCQPLDRFDAGARRAPRAAGEGGAVSKSQQKCEEWGRVARWQERIHTSNPLMRSIHRYRYDHRIIGGTKAFPGEFPHMAAVGYTSSGTVQYLCGGSLISERWVLTAAHCIEERFICPYLPLHSNRHCAPRWVRLGDVRPEASGEHLTAQTFHVKDTVKHPKYEYPLKYYDVGLLLLDSEAKFNQFVRPACLSTHLEPQQNAAIATGWGKTENAMYSEHLLEVELPLVPQQQCVSSYDRLRQESRSFRLTIPRGIIDSMLCAGNPGSGKDACRGDSGGPLQVRSKRAANTWTIVGVTSFGKNCAEGYPGVFSRVASFVDWIEAEVWP